MSTFKPTADLSLLAANLNAALLDAAKVMRDNGDPVKKNPALLPNEVYDRAADKMANAISRISHATAQILFYDIGSRVGRATSRR